MLLDHTKTTPAGPHKRTLQAAIDEGGPASAWRVVKPVIDSKKGTCRTQPAATVDTLNRYFVSVGPKVAAEVRQQTPSVSADSPETAGWLPRVGACAFRVAPISLDHLFRIVAGMRSSSASGPDGLCIRVFKRLLPFIGHIFLDIINASLTLAEVPDAWKASIIHPIHKTGDPSDPSNFRPISIVPVIGKITERVVQKQLYHYLNSNHLLTQTQHGFRPRHSTETALLSITDRILTAMDQTEVSLLCLLDLSKCFDVIDHSKLLSKLQLHGIDTAWFKNYLSGHTQAVCVTDQRGNRQTSAFLPNSIGVFQGSALGPLLYCIFTNDLSLYVPDGYVTQYADDTQIVISGKKSTLPSLVTRMETSLAALYRYFIDNGLKVNPTKTQLIVLGSRQNLQDLPQVQVSFREARISEDLTSKNLGLIFDKYLTWDSHISAVAKKCTGILIGLSHVRHYLPTSILNTIVTSLVISHVRYCISVYGNCSTTNLHRLDKIINFAARVITGRRKFDHISDVRYKLGLLRSADMHTFHSVAMVHKLIRTGEPEHLASLLATNADTRNRHTRRDEHLRLPQIRTEAGRRRFFFSAAAKYNQLPPETKAYTLQKFKTHALRHIRHEDASH